MMRKIIKFTIAMLPALLLLVGCGTTGEATDEDQQAAAAAAAEAEAARRAAEAEAAAAKAEAAKAEQMQTTEPQKLDPFDDPNNMLSVRVVFFDFDSSAIRDDALAVIKAHSDYLSENSGVSITLEGHTDERGTREYNLALGERRADAVRRMMIANGVSPSQIRVVSYGEERPAVLGHDEDAWSQNRRTEIVYANR